MINSIKKDINKYTYIYLFIYVYLYIYKPINNVVDHAHPKDVKKLME